VLKLFGGVAVSFALAKSAQAAALKSPPKPQNVLSPKAALDRLMAGNTRYVEGVSRRHDFAHEREALTKGQNPFAAILGCADSRVSIPGGGICSFAASPEILPTPMWSPASNTRSKSCIHPS
jgi:hypothetical protein